MADDDLAIAWQAEELLFWLAGDAAPREVIGALPVEKRKKVQAAWAGWWKGRREKHDMAEPFRAHRRPGLVLLHERGQRVGKGATSGWLWVGGCDGRLRWWLDGLAQVMQPKLGMVADVLYYALYAVIAGVFVMFGRFANRGHQWAFIVGMIAYALDGLLLVPFQDWMGVGFHALVLYWIWNGLQASRQS